MNKRILFTHSYFLRFDPKQLELGQPYPPLGTLYAAAVARAQGAEVTLHDTMFARAAAAIAGPIDASLPDLLVIWDDGFNYLTKMCLTNMREAAFRMIRIASERGIGVVVSSSDATDHYEKYLAEGADIVLLGEGEATLKELLEQPGWNTETLATIQGIAYKNAAGTAVANPKRAVIRDLDALPMPAWDLLEIGPYRETWLKKQGYFSLNMGTTRGCPYKCNWCAKPIYGNRYHSRSPEHVVAELKMLAGLFGMDHIWFSDDIFGLKPGWIRKFSELLNNEGLKIRYKIQSRADLLAEEATVKALAESGCETVWIGAESGSQRVLDAMDKGITVAEIHTATKLMKQYGIRPAFFIQFGYPGEAIDDIRLTLHMLDKLMPHDIGVSVSYPLPGTLFYETVKSELSSKANWTDSNELALMFSNTYPAAFYKQLHRYVHKNFRRKQSIAGMKRILRSPGSSSVTDMRQALKGLYFAPASLVEKLRLHSQFNIRT